MTDTTIWGEEWQTPLEVSQATAALPSYRNGPKPKMLEW